MGLSALLLVALWSWQLKRRLDKKLESEIGVSEPARKELLALFANPQLSRQAQAMGLLRVAQTAVAQGEDRREALYPRVDVVEAPNSLRRGNRHG